MIFLLMVSLSCGVAGDALAPQNHKEEYVSGTGTVCLYELAALARSSSPYSAISPCFLGSLTCIFLPLCRELRQLKSGSLSMRNEDYGGELALRWGTDARSWLIIPTLLICSFTNGMGGK